MTAFRRDDTCSPARVAYSLSVRADALQSIVYRARLGRVVQQPHDSRRFGRLCVPSVSHVLTVLGLRRLIADLVVEEGLW